jgi:hypothetical protein
MAKLHPRQIRLTNKKYAELKRVADAVGLVASAAHRLALDYGLPIVERKLGKKKL